MKALFLLPLFLLPQLPFLTLVLLRGQGFMGETLSHHERIHLLLEEANKLELKP